MVVEGKGRAREGIDCDNFLSLSLFSLFLFSLSFSFLSLSLFSLPLLLSFDRLLLSLSSPSVLPLGLSSVALIPTVSRYLSFYLYRRPLTEAFLIARAFDHRLAVEARDDL
jgi:hypothetical protein